MTLNKYSCSAEEYSGWYTICPGPNKPRSPPFELEVQLENCLAAEAKEISPLSICPLMKLALPPSLRRMCEAFA